MNDFRMHHHGPGGRRPGRIGRDPRHDGFGPGDGLGHGFGPHGHRGTPDERMARGRGRGGRGRRGDVRSAILLLLGEEPMHGYELIQQIAERSGGIWKPSPGSIYPALAQLEDEGLVLIEKVAGRKTAKLTDTGAAYVAEHKGDLGNPWEEISAAVGRPARELRTLLTQLTGAVRQVASVGTAAQADAAAEVLTAARRSVYRILADEPGATGAAETNTATADSGDTETDPGDATGN